MANKSKKQIPGIDYEAFCWQDYIGGPYSYVEKFCKDSAENILRRGIWDRRIVKALGSARIAVDDLKPYYGRASFYGKARIAHIQSKSGRLYEVLISYNAAVAMLDNKGHFIRLWNGYSATTARHIDAFRARFGMCGIGKHNWLALPIGKWNGMRENAVPEAV